MLVLPEVRPLGPHCREARARDGISVREAVCELLPSVAVTTAVWALAIVPAVAMKFALVEALDTVTDAGTVRLALLSLSPMMVLAEVG